MPVFVKYLCVNRIGIVITKQEKAVLPAKKKGGGR